MAKAVSGEAGVPFSPSPALSLLEMFVGRWRKAGPRLLRPGQAQIRRVIVFSLRRDRCVGRHSRRRLAVRHDEREQTLNQNSWSRMDGSTQDTNVIIVAGHEPGPISSIRRMLRLAALTAGVVPRPVPI